MRINLKYPFLFVLMIVLQVFIFNNIQLSGYINPQVYVFFILVLPINIKGTVLLLLAFAMGLIIDAFTDALAIHALSCLLMAFFRPSVLRIFSNDLDSDIMASPSYYNLGAVSLFLYSLILVLIHHSTLFFLELFRFNELFQTLSRIFLSSTLTMMFILVAFAFTSKAGD